MGKSEGGGNKGGDHWKGENTHRPKFNGIKKKKQKGTGQSSGGKNGGNQRRGAQRENWGSGVGILQRPYRGGTGPPPNQQGVLGSGGDLGIQKILKKRVW